MSVRLISITPKAEENLLFYLAGLFDGEGYIYVARSKVDKKHTIREYRFQCYAGLTIREKQIPFLFKNKFGGKVRLLKRKNNKHSDVYKWLCNGKALDKFIDALENYVIIKKQRLKTAKKFQVLKHEVKNKSITNRQYRKSITFFNKMRLLNKRGPRR